MSQPLIPRRGQSGLLTRIATVNASLCEPMKNCLRSRTRVSDPRFQRIVLTIDAIFIKTRRR